MHKPLTSRLAAKRIRSMDALARHLKEEHPEFFSRLEDRSLSARLGDLNNGKPAWWEKRAEELQCVLDLLGLRHEDVALHKKPTRYVVDFPVFRDIPPLDLRHEAPWQIGQAVPAQRGAEKEYAGGQQLSGSRTEQDLQHWLGSVGYAPNKLQWLHVADPVEYQLLVKRVDADGRHPVIAEKSLSAVMERDDERLYSASPLVIAIQEDVTLQAMSQFATFGGERSLPRLIISTSAPPGAEQDATPGWGKQAAAPGIDSWVWRLAADWRRTMLEWIAKRIGKDTLIDWDSMHELLNRFDSDGQWFSSVTDVLVLCQAAEDRKQRRLTKAMESGDKTDALLDLLVDRKEWQSGAIQTFVEARWGRWDIPWAGGIPAEIWRSLAERPRLFTSLLDRSFVEPAGKGFDFANPIVARLVLRRHLFEVFEAGTTADWAPACFDADRRSLLDAALDAVPLSVLMGLCLKPGQDDWSADFVGATEALFIAIGRRMIRGEIQASDRQLSDLAAVMLSTAHKVRELAWPVSRFMQWESRLDWIAVCWAWSLQAAPLADWTQHWLFPGWCETMPDELADWLDAGRNSLVEPVKGWATYPVQMSRLLSVVFQWMARLTQPPHYKSMPSVFRMALLAHAANGKWGAEHYWWYGLFGNRAAEKALIDLLGPMDATAWARVARGWWVSLIQHMKTSSEERFPRSFAGRFGEEPQPRVDSLVFEGVMARLEPVADEVLIALDASDRKFLCAHPQLLSPAFARELLRIVVADSLHLEAYEIPAFLSRFGREAASEFSSLLDHEKLGIMAAHHLWDWEPAKAKDLMRKPGGCSRAALKNLVLTCPMAVIAIAISSLLDNPDVLTLDEKKAWAYSRLPGARQHANALLRLVGPWPNPSIAKSSAAR